PVELEGVGVQHSRSRTGGVQDLIEHRDEVTVELDGRDPRPRLRKGEGEGAEPGADLDHPIARLYPGQAHDAPDGVGVDDEVLAERAARAYAVPVEELLRLAPGVHPDKCRPVRSAPGDADLDDALARIGDLSERALVEIDDSVAVVRTAVRHHAGGVGAGRQVGDGDDRALGDRLVGALTWVVVVPRGAAGLA